MAGGPWPHGCRLKAANRHATGSMDTQSHSTLAFELRAASRSHGSSVLGLETQNIRYQARSMAEDSCGRSSMKGVRASSSMPKALCSPLILARRPGIHETTTR